MPSAGGHRADGLAHPRPPDEEAEEHHQDDRGREDQYLRAADPQARRPADEEGLGVEDAIGEAPGLDAEAGLGDAHHDDGGADAADHGAELVTAARADAPPAPSRLSGRKATSSSARAIAAPASIAAAKPTGRGSPALAMTSQPAKAHHMKVAACARLRISRTPKIKVKPIANTL